MSFPTRLFPLADRTYAQRLRDDEDHELRLCGLLPDERDEREHQDYSSRHYDAPELLFASPARTTPLVRETRKAGTRRLLTGAGHPLSQAAPYGREASLRAEAGSTGQPGAPREPVGPAQPSCMRAQPVDPPTARASTTTDLSLPTPTSAASHA